MIIIYIISHLNKVILLCVDYAAFWRSESMSSTEVSRFLFYDRLPNLVLGFTNV